jgi:hypothetical protein
MVFACWFEAYELVVEFGVWRKALKVYGVEFLSEIGQNSLTGDCAKEVANYLVNTRNVSVEES